jgi:hypothetical protein
LKRWRSLAVSWSRVKTSAAPIAGFRLGRGPGVGPGRAAHHRPAIVERSSPGAGRAARRRRRSPELHNYASICVKTICEIVGFWNIFGNRGIMQTWIEHMKVRKKRAELRQHTRACTTSSQVREAVANQWGMGAKRPQTALHATFQARDRAHGRQCRRSLLRHSRPSGEAIDSARFDREIDVRSVKGTTD